MLFDVFSIRVKLGFSFVAAVTLMLLFSKTQIALLSLLSSVAHEMGHILCLFLFGMKPDKITLGFFGMRMECHEEKQLSYGRDAIFLLGGIFVNLLIAAVSRTLFFTGSNTAKDLFTLNSMIALFNLLPVESLDGGKALSLLLCKYTNESDAAMTLQRISYLTVAFLTLFGIYLCLYRQLSLSFVAVTVYLLSQIAV